MAIAAQIKRLGKHSAIYGLGGLVQRIVAVLLLPLYTRFLSPSDYGAIEALVALSAVLITLLRATIQSSFFRFYFNTEDEQGRLAVIRPSRSRTGSSIQASTPTSSAQRSWACGPR